MSMGMPCESSYYESRPKASTEQTQEKAMTDTTTAYAQAVLDKAAGRISQANLDKAEQVATTAHEEEQSFIDGMLSDFREDALRSAARTTGIDQRFWLTVAEKVA